MSNTRSTDSTGAIGSQSASELSELVKQASANTLAANALIGIQGSDVAAGARALLKVVTSEPKAATTQYAHYLRELGRVLNGGSHLAPELKDRRFSDPAWQSNFLYKRLMQAHLATQKEFARYIEGSKLDTGEKGRAHFFASLVTDALAPSNWLLGNPSAVRRLFDTGGQSLVAGLKNLAHDARHNHMLPSQVDSAAFKVGINLATTPGQVVYRCEMFELIQYQPTTSQVHSRPLVMVPPQINKFYAVDLAPEKSLVKWAVDTGIQFFMISWCNPGVEQRHWGLQDYAMAIDAAVDVARAITGSPDANLWGSCSGGMTLAAYVGYLAAIGQRKVVNVTWVVCILDTGALADTTLGLFNSPSAIAKTRARANRKGVVSGSEMSSMFAWLRPNDLIWNYWVNNYLLGNKPPAFDLLAWNADTTRLPARFYSDLLDLVERNPFVRPGALEVAGVPVDLSKVDIGVYVIGGLTDHITPWKGCYNTARLFGDKASFVLANAGHLQSLINPPGTPRAFFLTAPAKFADPEQWAAGASRHEGSWWPHWGEWIRQRSGQLATTPKKLGSRKHKPLAPAPGEYVHVH